MEVYQAIKVGKGGLEVNGKGEEVNSFELRDNEIVLGGCPLPVALDRPASTFLCWSDTGG